jgi:hypothetical protein
MIKMAIQRLASLRPTRFLFIAFVLLLAAGRLAYLRGSADISEGAQFDGRLTAYQTQLLLAAYRFYTSPNKGFASTFI